MASLSNVLYPAADVAGSLYPEVIARGETQVVQVVVPALTRLIDAEIGDIDGLPEALAALGGRLDTLLAGTPAEMDTFLEAFNRFLAGESALATLTGQVSGKQPLDPTLTALAGLATAANRLIYATGPDTFTTTVLTTYARTLLGADTAAAARDMLGVLPGRDVQAWDADLDALGALTTQAFGRALLTMADAPAVRAALGLGSAALATTGAAPGNVPVIDAGGKLLASLLPALAITDTFEVASQADMLALAGARPEDPRLPAERGDIAVRSDLNRTFVLKAEPASALANWVELKTPTDVVLSVAGLQGVIPAEALKLALALAISDVDGLTASLAAKAPLASPALTGTPTAPTAAANTNTTQLATTAFVLAAIGAIKTFTQKIGFGGVTSPTAPVHAAMGGTASTDRAGKFESGATQYGTALEIVESSHATSRRAGIKIGSSWTFGQDSVGDGKKDLFAYSSVLGALGWSVDENGNFKPGLDAQFGMGLPTNRWYAGFFTFINLTGQPAPASSAEVSGAVGDVRVVGNTLYWRSSSGWVRTVGTTF